MSQALYRKWRPQLWDAVIGQKHIVNTLKNAIASERIGHAYLFAGPRGTGKTTTARLLAKAVNCLQEDPAQRPCNDCQHCLAVNDNKFLDLIEIDAASNTSVDDIRDLRDKINFSPSQGKYKVYIIDEVHMLSTAAFNALLKTLEEPPAHAIFILATTEVHKIPATVLSRCQRHEFRRYPISEIMQLLKKIASNENIDFDEDALRLIARQSTGAMRDAISLLDQLSSTGEKITLDAAQTILGTATNQVVIEMIDAILQNNSAGGLNAIHNALDSGADTRQLARQTVEYLRSVLMLRMGNQEQIDAPADTIAQMKDHAQAFEHQQLLECIKLFNKAASESRGSWQPNLILELAFAEASAWKGQQSAAVMPAVQAQPPTQAIPAAAPALTPQPAAKQTPQPRAQTETQVVAQTPARETAKQETPQPPAEQPQAEPVQEAPQTAGTPITLQELRQHWPNIRRQLKTQKPIAEALLNSCKTYNIKEGVLVLGFAAEVVKEKMEGPENLELTQAIISHFTGKTIRIRCEVVSQGTQVDTSKLDIDDDSMVNTALNLGGQITQQGN